jgi:hypothetical protein
MNPLTKRLFIILIPLFVLMIGGVFYFGTIFAPGSYVNAEEYEFNVSEIDLINAIKKFKIENAKYCVPEEMLLRDGQSSDADDHWYHVYFFYPEENQIISTWVRGQFEKDKTEFAFVSVNRDLSLVN